MARHLESNEFRTYISPLKPNTGRKGIDELAVMLKEFIDTHIAPAEKINLVGFSMGGLVCRYYLQQLGGISRVHRMIFISTPHYGSVTAYVGLNKGIRQMRPQSAFLTALNQDFQTLQQIQVTSLWTPYDLMVLPARSCHIPIGSEIKIPVLMHRLMIYDRRCIEAVSKILRQ